VAEISLLLACIGNQDLFLKQNPGFNLSFLRRFSMWNLKERLSSSQIWRYLELETTSTFFPCAEIM